MSPKIYIATNHAIRGDGSSFTDRQWLLGFSDFYNDQHKPIDDFGCNFFSEWDFEQWNLCWNLIANCVQLYLQHGVVQAPQERLVERRLRQEITEVFIAWADEYYSDPAHMNHRIPRRTLFDEYCKDDVNARKFSNSTTEFKKRLVKYCEYYSDPAHMNHRIPRRTLFDEYCKDDVNARKFSNSTTEFKKRLVKYCEYKGYIFNPHKYDPVTGKPCKFDRRSGNPIIDDKSGGVEYFTVGDKNYYMTPEYKILSEPTETGKLDF